MKRLSFLISSVLLAGIAGVLAGFLSGCSARQDTPLQEPEEGETVTRAMYVPFGKKDSNYVMVGQDMRNTNVFTVIMPEEIYNLAGEKITAGDLQKGNILEITGNGLMLESYPGQYPGVTKIRVVEQGDPADADQYQSIIDQIYVEPDPSEPPILQIEHLTELVASCTNATRGGYEWTWTVNEQTGEKQSAIACGSSITEWKEISSVTLEKPDRLNLLFSQKPSSVKAERLPREQDAIAAEAVETLQEDGTWFINAEPGYLYAVYAQWEDGRAEYGFVTEKKQ